MSDVEAFCLTRLHNCVIVACLLRSHLTAFCTGLASCVAAWSAMLLLMTGHGGPCPLQQACPPGTTEPDSCHKRPAEDFPWVWAGACMRAGGSLPGDDSLDKQNVLTEGTHDTQPVELTLRASTSAYNGLMSMLLFLLHTWLVASS